MGRKSPAAILAVELKSENMISRCCDFDNVEMAMLQLRSRAARHNTTVPEPCYLLSLNQMTLTPPPKSGATRSRSPSPSISPTAGLIVVP